MFVSFGSKAVFFLPLTYDFMNVISISNWDDWPPPYLIFLNFWISILPGQVRCWFIYHPLLLIKRSALILPVSKAWGVTYHLLAGLFQTVSIIDDLLANLCDQVQVLPFDTLITIWPQVTNNTLQFPFFEVKTLLY